MKTQGQKNLQFLMQPQDNHLLTQNQEMESFCERQKFKYEEFFNNACSLSKNHRKSGRDLSKAIDNNQLEILLQFDTVTNSNISYISLEKKKNLADLSFFSKDCTQDLSNQEGYHQLVNKIHFQRSRNRQLHHELGKEKEKNIQKYLKYLMEEFKQLSEQNKWIRQIYRKQAGGGYKQKLQKNFSMRQQEFSKYNQVSSHQYPIGSQTPRNNRKNGRKSITALSMIMNYQKNHQSYNSLKPNTVKDKLIYGVGNQNFKSIKNVQNLKPSNELHVCQNSITMQKGQIMRPTPKRHRRRESQLTQRKDYSVKQDCNNNFLLVMDSFQGSFDEELELGRLSQPGKMQKQGYLKPFEQKKKCSNNLVNILNTKEKDLNASIEINSLRVSLSQTQIMPVATSAKNIFLQFLQTLLVEEKINYAQMSQQMNQGTIQGENNFLIPSYHNIKYIEQLEKQINAKNLKLKQLQEIVNVFKQEVEQIVGTDIKLINQLMVDLLQVKGKYLDMQDRVNHITGLKTQLQFKQKIKEDIITDIKAKTQRRKKEAQLKQEIYDEIQTHAQFFPIPQSLKTLFDLLNIRLSPKSKPSEYLNHIKDLPKSKDLFQAIDSKKRAACNIKIRQIIDQIRQGRKKFNEVIKIYESRIVKLQQKLQKYKHEKGKVTANG